MNGDFKENLVLKLTLYLLKIEVVTKVTEDSSGRHDRSFDVDREVHIFQRIGELEGLEKFLL